MEAAAEQWQEATRHQIGPKTRQGYDSVLRTHIVPEFEPRRLAGIDAGDIQRFANQLAEPETVRNVLAVLKELTDLAVRRITIARLT